jgi:hypothetical protein
MDRRTALTSTMLLCAGLAIVTSEATAKTLKDQLVGAWTVVSSTTTLPEGGSAWGSNPKSLYIFTEDGHYSSHLMRSDRPKFKANSRVKGTAAENEAAVHGAISSFGTYSVDEANKTITIRFEGSSNPNREGTEQTRPFTIEGDELRVSNPAPSTGGPPSQLIYKRAK